MQVQGRIVNTKRHTIGYKVGGVNRSRAEAVRLARQNRIDGVIVRRGGHDEEYLATRAYSYPNLYDLPIRVTDSVRSLKR